MAGKRKRAPKEVSAVPSASSKKAKKHDGRDPKIWLTKEPFAEEPNVDNRKREAALYEMLGSEDDQQRIEAADCIVSSLLSGDGASEAALRRHLDRRLFRGLASGRNASRVGFSLVITELLGQLFGDENLSKTKYTGLTFDKVLDLLVDKTQAVGNIPGQEERDHFFGQLFGIECFVRSQILFTEKSRWHAVLDLLLRLGNKKIWLRSQCGWVLVQALQQMGEADVNATLQKVADAGLAKTPEGVAAWIVALNSFPKLKVQPWVNPLSKKSLGDLTAVLKESFKEASSKDMNEKGQNGAKQASWSAQLHFVWDIILARFIATGGDDGSEDFSLFWNRVVDDGLFSKNATDGQKFKGFMVFQKMLEGLINEPEMLESLFSKNFMSCLVNQAAKEDRYLHRAATKALKAMEATVSGNTSILTPVLSNLLGQNGSYNFDQRTSTKTIDRLLQNTNEENAEGVLVVIKHPLKSLKQKEAAEAQMILRVYADYVSKVLSAFASASAADGQTVVSGKSLRPVLQELASLAYSQPKDVPKEALTDKIRETSRARLESSLAKLARCSRDFEVFCGAVASIDSSGRNMTPEIKSAMDDALTRMKKLLKRKYKRQVDKDVGQGLAMLHAISIFQLYNEDPDAMEVLSDLSEFYERLENGKPSEDDETSGLLVEILLSMVARPSSLMRQVSQQVFEAFTAEISSAGLGLLTGPLASGESTKGQQELFNLDDDAGMDIDGSGSGSDSGSDESEDEVSEFEIGSDVEFIGLNGADDEAEGGEVDDDEEEDDDEESGEEGEGEGEKDGQGGQKQEPQDLEELVGQILRSHRLDKDGDAESSSSDGDMSDSAMLAMDEKLAEVFKHRANATKTDSKKQKKDAKQSVVNFKHRILDLLAIYAKKEAEAQNPLCFSLLVPLLNLMRTTSAKALANKAGEVIFTLQRGLKKARSARRKENDDEDDADESDLLPLLVEVHEEARKDNSHQYQKAASAASLMLASTMVANKEPLRHIIGVYGQSQEHWMSGEAEMQGSFFLDWHNWSQNYVSSRGK